jgi:putative nucleotidyltransferase with HDIG domain
MNSNFESKIFKNILDGSNIVNDLILLDKNGLLDNVLPELTNLKSTDKGHKDNFIHTLQVVRQVCEVTNDKWLILASILHDVGKAVTKRYVKGHGWTFHHHEQVGANMVDTVFDRLDLDKSKLEYVKNIVFWHGLVKDLTTDIANDSAIRRFDKETQGFQDDLLLFCKCDITTKYADRKKRLEDNIDRLKERILEIREIDKIAAWRPPITGQDIMDYMGLGPGRIVGQMKSRIEKAIKDGIIPETREAALEYMEKISKEYK